MNKFFIVSLIFMSFSLLFAQQTVKEKESKAISEDQKKIEFM